MLTDDQMENVMGRCLASTTNWHNSSKSTQPPDMAAAGLMYQLPPHLWHFIQFRYCNDCRVECMAAIEEQLQKDASLLWQTNDWCDDWAQPFGELALKMIVFPMRYHTQKSRYQHLGIGKTLWFTKARHAFEALCAVLDRWEAEARRTIARNMRYSLH